MTTTDTGLLKKAEERISELEDRLSHTLTSLDEGTLPWWQAKHDELGILLVKTLQRIAELEAQLEAWKATAEQFKVSWGNEREALSREWDIMRGALQEIAHKCGGTYENSRSTRLALEALKALVGTKEVTK